MRPYMTFSNCDIFECLTSNTLETKEAAKPHPAMLTRSDPRPSIPLTDEPATLTTMPAGPADGLAATATPLEAANNVREQKTESIPTGLQSIHPTWQPLWGHCACSSSQRRAHCHLIEEQQGNKDDFTLASPHSSSEPV